LILLATARGLRSNAFHAYGIAVAAVVIATPAHCGGGLARVASASRVAALVLIHHGFGVLLAIWYFAYRVRISFLTIADLVATICPISIFLVRIGNFINSEHWGRPTAVPWAIVFPDADAQPRHPSQLYEAALEGVLLAVVLGIVARNGGFRRPGLLTGLFTVGYALARIAMEFFREPDSEIEQLAHGLTMGMVLSAPMLAIGIALLIHSAWMSRRLKPE
jgi:prolipoprotein diacylglyceryl transferase